MNNFTTALENIQHARLNDLVEYWKSIKKNQFFPYRRDFNPVDIPKCLPHIVLVDVIDGNPKYQIRLAGSAVNPVYRTPITGKYIEDFTFEGDRQEILAQYDHAVKHQVPTYLMGKMTTIDGNQVSYERVILPMTSDGKIVDKLLTGIHYFNVKQQHLDRPIFKL